ncbi:hypothetical protein K493DRAFT_341575 [Basidiobolus meristosporus CBS 931.73]|uniref:Uncharacterized protein n=1 Tax=Basidiobolus meristosporus CBS 931.73 TaxID=1314790 RepID=A0A1Y1XM09_9FUNG|nr:hypothetical protein K493DRAFT_341575 [Basidiobolus meristosporus CBS 931.73]|eukprot:ORX86789.1 hypothetical protein K493DRAFT_341575 [Basidiobolus meristosporus CBS 931.73]
MATQQRTHRPSLSDIRDTVVKDLPAEAEAVHLPSVFEKPITASQGQENITNDQQNEEQSPLKLPSKEDFENVLNDSERAMALYEAVLDTHKKIVNAVEASGGAQSQAVVPDHWSVQLDPKSDELTKKLLEHFYAPESNFFLPEDDDKLVEVVNQWDLLPSKVFCSEDSKRKLAAWMRTTYTVERAAIRKKVLGLFMSMRKHRKFDIISLTREIVPEEMPVKLHMVRKTLLLRTASKDSGSWDNKDQENKFWDTFLKEYQDMSALSPEQVTAYWDKLLQIDIAEHGPLALDQIDVIQADGTKWKGLGN